MKLRLLFGLIPLSLPLSAPDLEHVGQLKTGRGLWAGGLGV